VHMPVESVITAKPPPSNQNNILPFQTIKTL
jgi:hypothetical protein